MLCAQVKCALNRRVGKALATDHTPDHQSSRRKLDPGNLRLLVGLLPLLAFLMGIGTCGYAQTNGTATAANKPVGQVSGGVSVSTVTSTVNKTSIQSDSGAYHLEWDGTKGIFVRHALGTQPEVRLPLNYLHTEPGPKGYAKYLTWFLARDNNRFDIVWCYLNDSGREFYCWLYQYPTNQVTSLRFVGDYKFLPSAEPVAPSDLPGMTFSFQPRYNGPDFTFKNWSRRLGALDTLPLQPTRVETFAAPLDESLPDISDSAKAAVATPFAATLKLSNLKVYPLHQIQVAQSNGWRKGGWRELHALALDPANNPWYLILYSNSPKGYAVDLKTVRTYVADYGEPVKFVNNEAVFGTKDDVVAGPPDVRIRRFSRLEIPLVRRATPGNPYSSVRAEIELRRPDGRTLRVPCFWDGGQTWRARFAPMQVGRWSWRSYSLDADLAGQTGTFTCIVDETGNKGFIAVNQGQGYRHGFAYGDGTLFYPVWLQEPTFYFPSSDTRSAAIDLSARPTLALSIQDGAGSGATGAGLPNDPDLAAGGREPKSFNDFKARVDAASKLGYNRFWSAYILDPVQFGMNTQANEGGAPFLNGDLDQLNPGYFQWMDRRIAYCNEHGVVPEISITDVNAPFLATADPAQITRLWSYILARYAPFNVTWNLFHVSGDKPYPATVDNLVDTLAPLTGRNDPYGHPLTTTVLNATAVPNRVAVPGGSGPVVFTPSRPASVIPILPGAQGIGTPKPDQPVIGGNDPNRGRNRFNRSRFNRSNDQSTTMVDSGSYLVNVDSNAAAEISSSRPTGRNKDIPAAIPDIRYSDSPWFQLITIAGGSPATLQYDYNLNRPIILVDSGKNATDETRHRMWETIMRGSFWVPEGVGGNSGSQKLDDPVSVWQIGAAKLLQHTIYSRLQPFQDMLGGPQETPFDRRRRHQAEDIANKEAAGVSPDTKPVKREETKPATSVTPPVTGTATAGDGANVGSNGPIYVLADPGWEYLIYFQAGGKVTLDLLEATGPMKVQWFNPRTGLVTSISRLDGGQYKTFIAPDANDWVLYLTRREK